MRARVVEALMRRVAGVQVSAPSAGEGGAALGRAIGTHNGHFHCDEAFACGMLQLCDEFAGMRVVRTRDASVLDQCHIVVDVGGTFEPEKRRFDHHQRDFKDVFFDDQHKTKLSSAGLVYRFYGKEILGTISKESGVPLEEPLLSVLHRKVYEGFVEHIDGIDNGIDAFSGEKNYSVTTHLSARVGSLNPAWNEEDSTEREMSQFAKAVQLTTTEFVEYVVSLLFVWLPARAVVETAVHSRAEIHPSGQILKLAQACPWKSHLFDLENEGVGGLQAGDLKYVLYPDSNGAWRVQCVPLEENSFTNRLSLPEKYRGVRDDQLSELWGIPDCIFVHASGFIAGNKTYAGALAMATQSLAQTQ